MELPKPIGVYQTQKVYLAPSIAEAALYVLSPQAPREARSLRIILQFRVPRQ